MNNLSKVLIIIGAIIISVLIVYICIYRYCNQLATAPLNEDAMNTLAVKYINAPLQQYEGKIKGKYVLELIETARLINKEERTPSRIYYGSRSDESDYIDSDFIIPSSITEDNLYTVSFIYGAEGYIEHIIVMQEITE